MIPGPVALLLGEMKDTGGEKVDELADVRLLPGQGLVGVVKHDRIETKVPVETKGQAKNH